MKERNYNELDSQLIFYEQKHVLKLLFDRVDLSKVVFVGGIADYLNLRDHYHLTVNDIDLAYEDENYVQNFLKKYSHERFKSKFYSSFNNDVIVLDLPVGKKIVHFDLFQREIDYKDVKKSKLLGVYVMHMDFDEMRKFHNNEISKQTSTIAKQKYEWKRLYKHSIKASLYNCIHHQFDEEYREKPMQCALTK